MFIMRLAGDFMSSDFWERYGSVITTLAAVLAIIVFFWILIRINHMLFSRLRARKGSGISLVFFERVITSIIVICGAVVLLSCLGGLQSVWKTLLGGTAIISAVLAFAAQDIIKDFLAGLMISIYTPFEIGNRILLPDGTVGIVKDITMRHIVIQGLDTEMTIVPNSKINEMSIINYSYESSLRSAKFNFYVAYGTDVKRAMSVIKDAIEKSPLSVPGKNIDGVMSYAPVYFMAYEESSLRLSTTVYYEPSVSSETLISDINLRVNEALEKNNIEIPYNYINVITKEA